MSQKAVAPSKKHMRLKWGEFFFTLKRADNVGVSIEVESLGLWPLAATASSAKIVTADLFRDRRAACSHGVKSKIREQLSQNVVLGPIIKLRVQGAPQIQRAHRRARFH